MRKIILSVILLSFFNIFSSGQSLNQSIWKFDKAHSDISFTVKHMVIAKVTGTFKEFDILFSSNKEDFTDAYVEVTIKVESINTENQKRDEHLRTADFFDVQKYPEIKFKSKEFKKLNENEYKIVGDLTIKGIKKEVIFDAIYNGSIKSPWGNLMYSWTVTIVINRFDFDLKWNQVLETGGLVVGKEVSVTANIELNK